MIKRIKNETYDEERSLYNLTKADVVDCVFVGPADGESVLKECRNIRVQNCRFSLRYPLWHAKNFELKNSSMDDLTRAPIWYSSVGKIYDCNICGVKAIRECKNICVNNCDIDSIEFGWRCNRMVITNSKINSSYFLFESKNVEIENVNMVGKYSFQYMKNVHVRNSEFDTKDAFWHSKNVIVENSVLNGEYLGWFSENLTLINCKIIGTQPLCYCKNLKLVECEMIDCDFSFEYSSVDASVKGYILSVKNPKSGIIEADSVGEVIMDNAVLNCEGKVYLRGKKIPV